MAIGIVVRSPSIERALSRAVGEVLETRVLLSYSNTLVNDPTVDPAGIDAS
jgi:hypothetical protein